MAYTDEITAQTGWREITCDEITKGMRVRTVVPYEDCIDCINTYEGIAGRQEGNDWWTPWLPDGWRDVIEEGRAA